MARSFDHLNLKRQSVMALDIKVMYESKLRLKETFYV